MSASSNGRDYEREVAFQLERYGWRVQFTPVSGDFGADLIGWSGQEKLVVQCKDWSYPVGLNAIQEIFYAKNHYRAVHCVVVARSGFTQAAKTGADKTGVLLFQNCRFSGTAIDRTSQRLALIKLEQEQEQKRALEKETIQIRAAIATKNGLLMQTEAALSREWKRYCKRVARAAQMAHFFCELRNLFRSKGNKLTPQPRFIAPPAGERRGAIRHCPDCQAKLRLAFASQGIVVCPVCKRENFFVT